MTGLPLIFVFILAVIVMIVAISKFGVHPFISIMCISLILGLVAGIPLVDKTLEDGTKIQGLASVIGAGFAGTFSSIGIVIILGALIGTILEQSWKRPVRHLNWRIWLSSWSEETILCWL